MNRLPEIGVGTIDQLGEWLDAAREVRDHEAFREGESILSPDQPEDDFITDADLRAAFLALAKSELLAVGHSAFLNAGRSERPAFLADGQVLKLDSGMKRAGAAWLVQRRSGRWSAIGEDGARLALTDFRQPGHSAPSCQDIETRLYAVHGTQTLPREDLLRAGSQRPHPSFRPCTHFSLGSLSNGMDTDGYYRFAVVAPLGHLVSQLLNVSPLDTFVLGDVPLTSQTVLVVPEGTSTAHLSPHIPVRTYPPEQGLRSVVEEAIQERRGWVISLPDNFDLDSRATIERLDTNTSTFFEAFLLMHGHVSFGGHASSEIGNAGIFGMIDRLIQGATRQYSAHESSVLSGPRTSFAAAMIDYYLERVDGFLAGQHFSPKALRPYEKTSRQVRRWLAIVKEDLTLRKEHRKTLAGACQSIMRMAHERAESAAELAAAMTQELASMRPYTESGETPEVLFAAEVFCVLPSGDLRNLIDARPAVVDGISAPRVFLAYSILRWLNLKTKRALQEHLDVLIAQALPEMNSCDELINSVFGIVARSLRVGSNRRADALAILTLPAVQEFRKHHRIVPAELARDESTVRFKNLGE